MGTGLGLGAAIGYERERTGHPAGLRTHLLVSLASTTFMLVSTQFVYFQSYGKDDLIAVDTSRIAASVVSGVGFLGAGAILRTGISIQGLDDGSESLAGLCGRPGCWCWHVHRGGSGDAGIAVWPDNPSPDRRHTVAFVPASGRNNGADCHPEPLGCP